MQKQVTRPSALEWQVFLGATAIERGLLTPYQLRGQAWTSPLQGVYADARLDREHGLRCRAAAVRLPPGVVLAGPSAAWLHGVEHAADYADDVHVIPANGTRISAPRGVRIHEVALARDEVTSRQQLRCSTPIRTAWDLTQWFDPVSAVVRIDGLLRLRVVTPADLAKLVDSRAGHRGVRRAQRAFDLADGASQSPSESRLRVRLVQAGLPRPVAQHEIVLPSGVVVHPDLAWPEFKVAVEYDGAWHDDIRQFHADRRRVNQLVAAGWIVLQVTSHRLRELHTVVKEVRAALRSRGWAGSPKIVAKPLGLVRRRPSITSIPGELR